MGDRVMEVLLQTEGQFKGSYPRMSIPADVDEQLRQSDPDPFTFVMPVMKIGAASGNTSTTKAGKRVNRRYGQDAAERLVRAIRENRPDGVLGHPPPGKRSEILPAVHWLEAVIEGDSVYGLGYVPPHRQDVRETIRVKKSVNSRYGTSIVGSIEGVAETGEVIGLEIGWIDLADAGEIGVPELGAVPGVNEIREETGMDPDTIINELKAERDKSRDDLVRVQETLAETRQEIAELESARQVVTELGGLFGEGADVVQEVRNVIDERDQLRRRNQVAELRELVAEKVKLAGLRPMVLEHLGVKGDQLISEMAPQTQEDAEAAIQAYLERDDVKAIAKALAVSEMGPGAVVPGLDNRPENGGGQQLEDTQDRRRAARGTFGF
jgi:hypothetical protein